MIVFDIELESGDLGDDGVFDFESCSVALIGAYDGRDFQFFDKDGVKDFIAYLCLKHMSRHNVCSWNGGMFDFPLIHSAMTGDSVSMALIESLCATHYDPMMMCCAQYGHPLSLDAVARGMGASTKVSSVRLADGSLVDMEGSKFVEYWNAGEEEACIEYLKGDLVSTYGVCKRVKSSEGLSFISKKGRKLDYRLDGWRNVTECLGANHRFPSWVTRPLDYKKRMGWMSPDNWLIEDGNEI